MLCGIFDPPYPDHTSSPFLSHPPLSPNPGKVINFGADPIRGVPGALGALGLPLGGATRGLPEQQFVKGKVYLFKEFEF